MGRFVTLIGLFACALGSAEPAHALSAECTAPLLSTAYDARLERPYFTTVESHFVPAAPHLGQAPPGDDDELPWCVSPEDPRCSPLPGHSAPRELAVRAFIAADATANLPAPAFPRTAQRFADSGLAPASGIADRLERPPRP